MKRIRRHKYLLLPVFFLMYSVIHAVPAPTSDGSTKTHDTRKAPEHNILNKLGSGVEDHNIDNEPESQTTKVHIPINDTTAHEHILSVSDQHVGSSIQKIQTNKDSNARDTTAHKHILGGLIHHVDNSVHKHDNKSDTEKVSQSKTDNKTRGNSAHSTEGHAYIAEQVIRHVDSATKSGNNSGVKNGTKKCTLPAIEQFPDPHMSQRTRAHGGLIIHIVVAIYMFIGLAIVCDEYFVASLDRICEELKMSPDVAGATFMAAGSSAPELAIVIIGVFLAKDDIGLSGVIGSAVFNIMFVIACCGLCSSVVVYLNWWPLVRDCFFYVVSILVMWIVIYDERITWVEALMMLVMYFIYCVVLHFNTPLEKYAHTFIKQQAHPTEQSGLVSYKTLDDEGKVPNYGMEWSPEKQQQGIAEDSLQNFGMEWSPEKQQQGFVNQLSGPALNQATIDTAPPPPAATAAAKPAQQDYYKPKEYDPSTQVNPLTKPEGGGWYAEASWFVVYPIHFLCRMTMPDCRSEKYRNWYPLTFFVSMVWISFYSYFMIWMITIIGFTMHIPDTVMGLTFVAAGVSVPDAISSIAVVREGYGDMAVSNAVGSNVFDILICLGLPWFINTAIVNPGSTVKVISKGLAYSTLSLLSTVVLLLVATHLNGWKLDRRYGIILLVWYFIFIGLASMYELNFFKNLNPVECSSRY